MLTVLRVAEDSFRELEPILILLLLVTFENSLEQSILFWWKRIFARHCVGCPALPVFNLCKECSTYKQRLYFHWYNTFTRIRPLSTNTSIDLMFSIHFLSLRVSEVGVCIGRVHHRSSCCGQGSGGRAGAAMHVVTGQTQSALSSPGGSRIN